MFFVFQAGPVPGARDICKQ